MIIGLEQIGFFFLLSVSFFFTIFKKIKFLDLHGLERRGGARVCVGGRHRPHLHALRHLQDLLLHGPGGQGHEDLECQVGNDC